MIIAILLVIATCVLVLVSGGYYGSAPAIAGIVLFASALIVAFARRRQTNPSRVLGGIDLRGGLRLTPLLFVALAIVYAISTLVNGVSLTSLAETGQWAAVGIVAVMASRIEPSERAFALRVLTWFGVASAVFGIAISLGFNVYPASMSNGRLQFTFQYANAAGLWFVAVAIMCALSKRRVLRILTILPVVALITTLSGGAIAVGVVAALALVIARAVRVRTRGSVVAAIVVSACVALAIIAALALFPVRVSDALGDFTIRLVYDYDALKLLATAPLLGVGPDNWQFFYQDIQSAQYTTTTVHCSYLQIATDAGILGLVVFVAACVSGVRTKICVLRQAAKNAAQARANKESELEWESAQRRAVCELAVALVVLVHALIDFDLQFGALAFLLALTLADSREAMLPLGTKTPGEGEGASSAPFAMRMAGLVLCFLLCATGAWASLALSHMADLARNQQYSQVISTVEQTSLANCDYAAQSYYLVALYSCKKFDAGAEYATSHILRTDEQALAGALCLYGANRASEGFELIMTRIEARPYDDGLMQSTHDALVDQGATDQQRKRFNQAVASAEQALSQGVAAAMPDQRSLKALYL